jgi:thiamine-monophosphate kinase
MESDSRSGRGERHLVRRLQAALGAARAGSSVPFGDDLAAILPEARSLLWSVDTLMDGTDFRSEAHDWRVIGRKAMAVNLSDCAAMAAVPVAALASVVLADSLTMEDALALQEGMQACGAAYDCPVVGGDTNSWGHPTVISVCIAARMPADRQPVRRDGARPGDTLWVTGRLGGSILGRHLTFEPRIEEAIQIARRLLPHAMIDISDGLVIDLDRMLEASGCGAVLREVDVAAAIHADAERLAAEDGRSALAHALYDGEDFELLVALPADVPASECARLGLLPLGACTREAGVRMVDAAGAESAVEIQGWEHFQ